MARPLRTVLVCAVTRVLLRHWLNFSSTRSWIAHSLLLATLADFLYRPSSGSDEPMMSPADRDVWQGLKRHVVRMMDGLALVETTLRIKRELGRPLTEEVARKVEGYARFGLGDPKAREE
jgi:hypothetical protein